jgi:hypothetical protein
LVKACARCAITARSSADAPRFLLAVLFVVSEACVAMVRRPSTQCDLAHPGIPEKHQWSLCMTKDAAIRSRSNAFASKGNNLPAAIPQARFNSFSTFLVQKARSSTMRSAKVRRGR